MGGALAEALLLQAASGVSPVAWGELGGPELLDLYALHERVMWFGSNLNASRSYGSSGLAYALASLEQLVTGVAYAGVEQSPSASLLLAIFGHDFNLLYLRKLLRVQWLTPSWSFNAASTGAHIAFELWRTADDAYEVVARYVAANLTQQGSNLPLTPPHAPPGTAELLREPYAAFRRRALDAIDSGCVATAALRESIALIAAAAAAAPPPPPPDSAWDWPHSANVIGVLSGIALALVLIAGFAGALLGGRLLRLSRRALAAPAGKHQGKLPLRVNDACASAATGEVQPALSSPL